MAKSGRKGKNPVDVFRQAVERQCREPEAAGPAIGVVGMIMPGGPGLPSIGELAAKIGTAVVNPNSPEALVEISERMQYWSTVAEKVCGEDAPLVTAMVDIAGKWVATGRPDMALAIISLIDLGNPDITWRAAGMLRLLAQNWT